MMSEITELLHALEDGKITLDEVAERFREHKWPRKRVIEYDTYEELAARNLQDPDPYVPGSFDDVAAAYHQKKISREQFRALSEAVADAQRAEDRET
jgi:hypothetical protein